MNRSLAKKRHLAFAQAYMTSLNGSQAALAAGYAAKNPKHANIIAWELLKREDVQVELKRLRKMVETDAVVTTTQIMERLSIIVRGDNDPNAIHASKELNLMRKVYHEGVDVQVQQRILNVQVVTPKARELTDQITDGYRTEASG